MEACSICSHANMFWGGCADMGDSTMAAWFRVDGHHLEMQIWQHGLGCMEICENLAMPTWCVVDEQRWEMQPLQHGWGACAEVGDAAIAAWFGVNGPRLDMQS